MADVVLLDAGVLFEFLADQTNASAVEVILAAVQGVVASVTVYELFRGVVSHSHLPQRNQLLSLVHTIDLTEQIATLAGQIYTDLQGSGNVIDNEDILLAATSLHHSIPIFTTNVKHFARIRRLHLYQT